MECDFVQLIRMIPSSNSFIGFFTNKTYYIFMLCKIIFYRLNSITIYFFKRKSITNIICIIIKTNIKK